VLGAGAVDWGDELPWLEPKSLELLLESSESSSEPHQPLSSDESSPDVAEDSDCGWAVVVELADALSDGSSPVVRRNTSNANTHMNIAAVIRNVLRHL
jgi:hypothetical protein